MHKDDAILISLMIQVGGLVQEATSDIHGDCLRSEKCERLALILRKVAHMLSERAQGRAVLADVEYSEDPATSEVGDQCQQIESSFHRRAITAPRFEVT